MKKLIWEFNEFVSRGSVIELAVGVIIGGVFGKIITSLVEDIIMPPVGLIIGGVNFTDIKLTLKESFINAQGVLVDPVTLNIGNFLQTLFNFFIIAFCIFMVVKAINKIKSSRTLASSKEAKAKISREEELLAEIRDILKNK
mgnify:CR=1 FL=1